MNKIELKMPGFFDEAHSIITMRRGKQRRQNHRQITIEILRALGDQKPTRDQLQKLARTQRKRFIQVLKIMLEAGDVERLGTGTKNDPYLYRLTDRHREPKKKTHFFVVT